MWFRLKLAFDLLKSIIWVILFPHGHVYTPPSLIVGVPDMKVGFGDKGMQPCFISLLSHNLDKVAFNENR